MVKALVSTVAVSVAASGLTGATAASRYVGATASGAPVSGTFAVGDFIIDQSGKVWVCTSAGTPGTWGQVGGSGGAVATDTLWDTKGDLAAATGADTAAKLAVGTFGQVPLADSTASTGLLYGAPEDLRSKYLKPTGSYETIPRTTINTNSVQLFAATGIVTLAAIALPKNFLVTNINWISGQQAAVTPTHWWFSLCDSSFVTLRSTADQTTGAIAANTKFTKALSSTFTTTYEGLHYIAFLFAAATVPSPMSCATSQTVVTSQLPRTALSGLTAQTSAPADSTNLAPSPGTAFGAIYAYVT